MSKIIKTEAAAVAIPTVTDKEFSFLRGIATSDFMDGLTGVDMVGKSVWTWSASEVLDNKKGAGALIRSLVKKGLVAHAEKSGDTDETVAFTALGVDAYAAEIEDRAEQQQTAEVTGTDAEPSANEDETSDEETSEDANDPAWMTREAKVCQPALDAKFLASLAKQSGPVKIGVLRADWNALYPTFAALKKGNNDKQQKAIMRRTLNRLLEAGKVYKSGALLSLQPIPVAVAAAAEAEAAEAE